MASIEKRIRDGQVRWYMRYRDPSGQQHTKPGFTDDGCGVSAS
jgi:hypothetical protein